MGWEVLKCQHNLYKAIKPHESPDCARRLYFKKALVYLCSHVNQLPLMLLIEKPNQYFLHHDLLLIIIILFTVMSGTRRFLLHKRAVTSLSPIFDFLFIKHRLTTLILMSCWTGPLYSRMDFDRGCTVVYSGNPKDQYKRFFFFF